MKLNEIGEFGFIERFSQKYLGKLPQGYTGIGDDCAVIPSLKGEEYTISTDMLIEDVHFVRAVDVDVRNLALFDEFDKASFSDVAHFLALAARQKPYQQDDEQHGENEIYPFSG